MKNLALLLLLCCTFALTSCDEEEETCPDVTTDSDANLDQFLGLWYEIASFPQFFSLGCTCTTAEYTLLADGSVNVSNNCILLGGAPNGIEGNAFAPDPSDFSKLKVSFPVSPQPGDYWILEFADDASYMLVGNPDRDQLFVLSRTPQLDNVIYQGLLSIAEDMCFDIDNLDETPQTCD